MNAQLRKAAAAAGAAALAVTMTAAGTSAPANAEKPRKAATRVALSLNDTGTSTVIRVKVSSKRKACVRFRKVYLLVQSEGVPITRVPVARGGTPEAFLEGAVVRTNFRGVWRLETGDLYDGRLFAIAPPTRRCQAGFSRAIRLPDAPPPPMR